MTNETMTALNYIGANIQIYGHLHATRYLIEMVSPLRQQERSAEMSFLHLRMSTYLPTE